MKKSKLYITRSIKIVCFILAVLLTVGLLQHYLLIRNDQNRMRMMGYYLEDKNSLDVVVIGASEVYSGFNAAYAYENYGFTSFPYATESSPSSALKTQIKEVLRTQNPQKIVIEINAFLYTDANENDETHIRKYLDNVPMGGNKIEYINENLATADQIEYYAPIVKYHGTWNDFPKPVKDGMNLVQLEHRGYSILKGFRTVAHVHHTKKKLYNSDSPEYNEKTPLDLTIEENLYKLLDFIKEENLGDRVIFVRFPHKVYSKSIKRVQKANTVGDIIHSYGFEYVNLERDMENTIGIDVNKDFYNWEHLNIYGCEKFTDYFSKMLCEDYGVKGGELTKTQKANWNTAVDYYHRLYQFADNAIKNTKVEYKLDETIKTLWLVEDYKYDKSK